MQVSQVTISPKRTAETTIDELRDHSYGLKSARKIRILPSKSDFGTKDALCSREFSVHRHLYHRPFTGKIVNNASVSYLLSTDRVNNCKGRELPAERLPFPFDPNMSSKPMPGSGKGIVVWDEEGEVVIWKKSGGTVGK